MIIFASDQKPISMNCWIALPLAVVMLTASRCAEKQNTLRMEPVRYEDGTAVTGEAEADSLFIQDRFLTDTTCTDKGDTVVTIRHASAYVRMQLGSVPRGADRILLGPTEGAVTEIPVTGHDADSIVLWMAKEPGRIPAAAAVALTPDGHIWSSRLPGLELEAGIAYRRDATLLSPEAPASGLQATPLPQALLDLPAGEYSGITWISEDSYAVVNDNLKGGGIVLFTIPIGPDGMVEEVTARIPEGTAQATGRSRDPEGIAFAPGRNRLYVSSEKHQDIREYNLEGRETGPGLRIPADLSTSAIVANQGFEALTFNEKTGLFWTTTEAPLKRDTFLPQLHRLQSFSRDGAPSERFFYQTDTPSKSPSEAAGAQAYVFGIPAITALDDGRLIILEREVYVPKGGLLDKFLDSFTQTNLYLVDPVRDGAGILRKSLLCTFTTRAMDLANFEGMCLGPTLPDGRRCLILIADSQNSAGGLTQEFVKVVLLR